MLSLFEVCTEESKEVSVRLDAVCVCDSLLEEDSVGRLVMELGRPVLVILLLLDNSILLVVLVVLKPLSKLSKVDVSVVSEVLLDCGTPVLSKKLSVFAELLVLKTVPDISGVLLLLREVADEMESVGKTVELKFCT